MREFVLSLVIFAAFAGVRADEKLSVVSLSTVLADIGKNVGGDKADVVSLVKAGIDPHDFEPTPGDIKAVSTAKVVLAAGLGFEGYLDKLETAAGSGPKFVVVGESIKPIMVDSAEEEDHGHEHGSGQGTDGKIADPHWWHSIANAKIATRVIRDAFTEADPKDEAAFHENARVYLLKLDALSKELRLKIAELPSEERILVTSHDALGYLAQDHGFRVYPVQGISTADQPSSKKVQDLIQEIRGEGVKAIFAENIENPKVLSEITSETGAKLGGTLYADGLGDKEASTYETMMRHNVTTIVDALK